MSTFEYYDLYIKCQDYAKFHMFTFDLKNSRSIDDLYYAELKLRNVINDLYNYLVAVEKENDIKILLEKELYENEYGVINKEPIILGDMVAITIYRNSMNKEELISLFNMFSKLNEFYYEVHMSDGYYETNKYVEGNLKYYRGYCVDYLSNKHKVFEKGRKI